MKTLLLTVSVLIVSAMPTWAELKIGHFDLQKIVSLSEAGKQAQAQHSAKARSYQHEIDSRSDKLKRLKEAIEALGKNMKPGEPVPTELAEKDKEYGVQSRELQRVAGGFQDELKVYEAELTRKVVDEFSPVLRQFAITHKYDYILRSSDPLVFAHEKHDLTDALIKEFNRIRK